MPLLLLLAVVLIVAGITIWRATVETSYRVKNRDRTVYNHDRPKREENLPDFRQMLD